MSAPMTGGARAVAAALEADAREARGFQSAADRVRGEREERMRLAARELLYHVPYLDDCLRSILPNHLVLLGAEAGKGKTDLAQGIAMSNASRGKRVHYLALEAESREIERRTKFKLLADAAFASGRAMDRLYYADWLRGRCDDITLDLEPEVEYEMERLVGNLRTYYRGANFGPDELFEVIHGIEHQTDLIILDHLHYVDVDDENENRAYKRVMKLARDIVLQISRPMILVVHLRKRDMRVKTLLPDLGEVHGSSEISKICTHSIMIGPARGLPSKGARFANTFMGVPKDRESGATGLVALCQYDLVLRRYSNEYTLGRAKSPGDVFEPLDVADVPRWAKHHVPMYTDENQPPPLTDGDVPPPQASLFDTRAGTEEHPF